jgi:hypothetical protein
LEVADHDFRIDEIFGATEGDETDFDHKRKMGAENTGISSLRKRNLGVGMTV